MPRAAWLAVGGIATVVAWQVVAGPVAAGVELIVMAAVSATAAAAVVAMGVRGHSAGMIAAGAGASLVAIRLVVGALLSSSEPVREIPTDERPWVAAVISVGSTADGRQRALASASDGSVEWRVYLWLPRYPQVAPTDQLAFRARFEPAPVDDGFGAYLARNGAVATARVSAIERAAGADVVAGLEGARRESGELIARGLPQPAAGLAAGILIGLRDLVDRDLAEDFATAGVSHVVAISGWNIALVGGIVCGLLRSWPRRRRALAMLVAIVAYTLLAGASASVVRAALMGGVALLARESGRRGGAATALGLAALAMVLVDPAIVEDVGFQLSVAATAGLLAWGGALSEIVRRRVPGRTPGWLVESLGISLAAQAATLPLVLLHFGRLSLVAPAANLIIAPLVAPAMLASLLGLAAGAVIAAGVPGVLVAPLSLVASLPLDALMAVGRGAAALPLASVALTPPLDTVGAMCAAGSLWAFGSTGGRRITRAALGRVIGPWQRASASAPRAMPAWGAPAGQMTGAESSARRRVAVIVIITGMILLVVAGSLASDLAPGRLRMTVLDIGQGDAVLLEGDRGSRVLIDGGPDPDRLSVLLDERIPAWDRRIDLVVLTHPHEDHVAGLALLLERFRVPVVAETGMVGAGPGDREFRAVMARSTPRRLLLAAGDRMGLDGATIAVLWPRRGEVPAVPPDDGSGINNVSIVLDVRFGARRILLTGDMEEEVDPILLAAGPLDGTPVDVLKVAHHGSRTATTAAFVTTVSPQVAVVSSGRDNPYGHPAPETMERLEATGARVLRTDLDGSVTISTDGRDLRLTSTGGRASSNNRPAGPGRARGQTASVSVPLTGADALGWLSCAVPVPGSPGVASPPPRPARGSQAERYGLTGGVSAARAARSGSPADVTLLVAAAARDPWPCYDRPHAHPFAARGGSAPRRASAATATRPPQHSRSRGRLVPGATHRGTGHGRGPPARGGCGAAP